MDDLDFGATIKGFNPGQKVFNRYTLKKILGRGGMGVVWLARDEELERDIALKFLPEVVALDKEAVRDLKRETRRSLELTHSHIVRIYDFIQDVRTAAISMEYIAGDTLAARKVDHPAGHFEAAELGPWVRQLLEALGYAHTKGEVVHRDLKPANLMIDARGDLKIADFGIAASVSDSVSRVSAQAGSSGTPVYMSPQQMMGEKPAVTDDIYATGATLYELLTGKPPFYSGNVMMQVQSKLPPAIAARRKELGLEGTAVPPAWEQTIAACLAKEPGDRPASAGEIAERLGLDGMATKSTKAEAGKAGRVIPKAPPAQSQNPRYKTPLYAGIAAGVILLAGLGYYFGVYAPEQKQQAAGQARVAEAKRLENEKQLAEAARLAKQKQDEEQRGRTEREKQDALAREQQQRETTRLANARGGIIVRTTPAGAEVTVGALEHGNAPLTIKEAKLGKYPVKVRLAGYEDWSGEVEVKENEFAELNATLVRSTGTVVLTGTSGAEVSNAGKSFGTLPLTLKDVPVGTVRFTIFAKGYKSAEVTGEVTRNAQLRLDAVLEKLSGPETGQAWTIPDLNLTMQPIAPGTFLMGSTNGQKDEQPVMRVTLTQPFWLGRTEVTQAQWQGLMGTSPSNFKGENLPAENVSWDDAMEFCRKLAERERAAGRLPEGYAYTLPTAAQWEYACRAGTTGDYAGNLDAMGWYAANSGSTTHPVGQKQANAWGLYDMHGNVWEWCLDWHGTYPGGSVTDPIGAPSGSYRVNRGGSWRIDADKCRSANRNWHAPGYSLNNLGFRLALVPVARASVTSQANQPAAPASGNGAQPDAATLALSQAKALLNGTIKVSVLGQVINPGQYTLEKGAKLSAVLRKAGGLNRLADLKKITIARTVSGAPQPLTANFIDIIAGRAMDIELQEGDVITVPERLI